jgi:flagellar protein FliS
MNLHHARASYRRTAQPEDTVPADPHAVIGLALSELQTALRTLAAAADSGTPLPPGPMTRTLAAIYLLQSSLDFDRGGEIAPALFRVYEHCRLETLAAFRKEKDRAASAQGLAQAAGFVAQIAEAWAVAGRDAAARDAAVLRGV